MSYICPKNNYTGEELLPEKCNNCNKVFNYNKLKYIKNQCCKNTIFKIKAQKIHGDKYNYSKSVYVNAYTKLLIGCKIEDHGTFEQTPANHLQGYGCSKCAGKYKYTTDEWKEKARKIHKNKYDYSLVRYKSNHMKVLIGCIVKGHGTFKQRPSHHLQGFGCSKCSGKYNYTTEEWKEKAREIHGNKYDYFKSIYVNNRTKVIIGCREGHGIFEQTPDNHLQGSGCPICRESRLEKYTRIILNTSNILFNLQHKLEETGKSKFDVIIPGLNILIELQGVQHFKHIRYWQTAKFKTQHEAFANRLYIDNRKCFYAVKRGYHFVSISHLCLKYLPEIINHFTNYTFPESGVLAFFYITHKNYFTVSYENNIVNILHNGVYRTNRTLQVYQFYKYQIKSLLESKPSRPDLSYCSVCEDFYMSEYLKYHYTTNVHISTRNAKEEELKLKYSCDYDCDVDYVVDDDGQYDQLWIKS